MLPELVLQGADLGLWGSPAWRAEVYAYGAFWAGLLTPEWRPVYPAQPVTMFLTYGFLHAGLAHLAFNVLTLLSVGAAVVGDLGARRFLALYGGSLLGGGAGFAALSTVSVPMVGASGALFGLLGALMVSGARRTWRRRGLGAAARGALALGAVLAAVNLAVWWSTDGALAWEAHLGGFLAGVLGGLLLQRR